MKKLFIAGFICLVSTVAYAETLGEQCQALSIDLIDLSNHQKNPDCQGFLGRSSTEVSAAGRLIDQDKIDDAKRFLNYAHNDLEKVAKMKCDYQDEIKLLTQKEELIASQL